MYSSETLQNMHTNLNEAITVLQMGSEICSEIAIKSLRHFDNLVCDYRFDNTEHQYKVNAFYYAWDKINAQITRK